jgi:hypothetical protein
MAERFERRGADNTFRAIVSASRTLAWNWSRDQFRVAVLTNTREAD